MTTNADTASYSPRDQPRRIHSDFYEITQRLDGLVDVYLMPRGRGGCEDCMRVAKGVEPWDGLEGDIRARYSAWLDSAEPCTIAYKEAIQRC